MCSWWTGTDEVVDEVDTFSTVEAGLRVTLIHIILAVNTLVAWFTFTFIRPLIVHTGSSIATWVGLAFIYHLVTITACVSRLALTLMGISNVYAAPSILAYVLYFQTISGSEVLTGHVGNITVKSSPPHRAAAGPGGSRLRAGPTIVAADLAAQVYKILAVEPIVSYGAGAAIGAQTISAGPSVLTGLGVTLVMLIFTESTMKTRATAT